MDVSVSSMFASHARRQPAALAITEDERLVSYGELQAKAVALGRALQARGVGRGDVVALRARRSMSQLIGALGIWSSGAAFLPLDPMLPRDRIAFALAGTRARAIVLAAGAARSPGDGDRHTIRLDDGGTLCEDEPDRVAYDLVERHASDLAYVIYTSGSTGEPKGVEVTDAALTNLVRWHQTRFDVVPSDRASHISPVGFDAAIWEVWPYLTAGASVHLADEFVAKDPEALRDWLVKTQITIGFAVTPLMERLMDIPWPTTTSLRTMLTGADRLRTYPPASLPFALVNNYGPTEATVVATSGIVPVRAAAFGPLEDVPSLGVPIDNTRIYVLDEGHARVPDGEEGEIWIAGSGLARGYAGRPDLTSERFVSDPFDAQAGALMYRTGDRGRVLATGELAFLGRLDEQIKIRGFRVETQEIEAALDAHPALAQSVVVLREVAPGDERLIAYVVGSGSVAVAASIADIGDFLAARLPSHMVPSKIVSLPAFPLTVNGKVDRVALRGGDWQESAVEDNRVAPRTPTEEAVARIVAPLLKLDTVSVEDNFFTLGGHSLLGTQVIARIRDAFGVKLGLRYLFEHPTIAALAREIDRASEAAPVAKIESLGSVPILKRRSM